MVMEVVERVDETWEREEVEGLKVRTRKGRMENPVESKKEEEAGHKKGSGKLDEALGTGSTDEINGWSPNKKISEVEFDVGGKDSEIQNALPIVNNKQILENVKVVTQSISSMQSEEYLENGTAEFEPVKDITEKDAEDILLSDDKLEVKDFEVEKVIAEQETHDLFCPNCHSCITKRVILRKRKRAVAVKPVKVPRVEPDHGATPTPPTEDQPHVSEPTGDQNQDTEVFRCLSCWSFFVATASGCLRVFGIKDVGQNVQSSQQVSDRNSSWLFSMFKSERTERQPAGSGTQNANEVTPPAFHPGNMPGGPGSLLLGGKLDGSTNMNGAGNEVTPPALQPTKAPGHSLHGVKLHGSAKMNGAANGTTEHVGGDTDTASVGAEVKDPPVNQLKNGKGFLFPREPETLLPRNPPFDLGKRLESTSGNNNAVNDGISSVEDGIIPVPCEDDNRIPDQTVPGVISNRETRLELGDPRVKKATTREWDILKSIIYGGLIESIASLIVVSSAAGSDASTLNIVALGLANLIGGLFVILHNLQELKKNQHGVVDRKGEENDQPGAVDVKETKLDQYQETLGRRENFWRHAIVAVLSYIIFGLLPTIVYGFSFLKSGDKDYKLIAVAAASFVCIAVLATAKVYVQRAPRSYPKTILYYLGLGFTASALSYVVGEELDSILKSLGWFDKLLQPESVTSGWASF